MDQSELIHVLSQMPKPIKWVIPDSARTEHATHVLLQQQGSEFILLFFELQGPVLTGTSEEQLAAYNQIESIEAKCVAKLVMSVENVALVANSFLGILDRLQEMAALAQKGQEHVNTTR